jgi:hypothetical protein
MKTYEVTIGQISHRILKYEVQAESESRAEQLAWARKHKELKAAQMIGNEEFIQEIIVKEEA